MTSYFPSWKNRDMILRWIAAFIVGVALIVWGAESFAEHLAAASAGLGVSSFALA